MVVLVVRVQLTAMDRVATTAPVILARLAKTEPSHQVAAKMARVEVRLLVVTVALLALLGPMELLPTEPMVRSLAVVVEVALPRLAPLLLL